MNTQPHPKVQTLSDWLQIATQKLTEASKKRIWTEIEAHYTQAVEAHRESGLSESEAQRAALAELGDARAAGKRFRKRHLTETDACRWEKSVRQARSIAYLLGAYCLFVFTIGPIPFWRNRLDLALACLVMIALPTARFLVARRGHANPNRPLLLINSLSDFAWWSFIFWYFITFEPTFGTLIYICFAAILYCAGSIGLLLVFLRLWNKLSKARATNPGPTS